MFHHTGLRANWFNSWNPQLDEALYELPELDVCPHELFCMLAQNPGPARKRIALITEQGLPVAIVCLRQKGRFLWEPLMQWIIPGQPFPSKPGYLMRVLDFLNTEMWVAWWRMQKPPSSSRLMRYVEETPTYQMSCTDDFEEFWRDNGHFKTIRRIRNRCASLKLVINAPGAAEWTIRNSEAKWREKGSSVDPSLSDKILAAKYLESLNKYFTFGLLDGETFAGGATMLVHQDDLVAGTLYREDQYHKLGIGDRLIDISFSYAKENGYRTIDICGGHEYKKLWAPQGGQRWWFYVCPEPLHSFRKMITWGKSRLQRK